MRRQHRKDFRAKILGDLSRRQFITRTTAAGLTIALPAWLAGCGDDGSSGAAPTPTPTPTGPRPLEDATVNFDFSAAELEDLEIHVWGSEDDGVRLQPHTG